MKEVETSLSLPQMWKRRSLVIPYLASASFSTLLGSWRVRVFKVESAVAGKGEVKAGMKILCSSSALTGQRSESTKEMKPCGPDAIGKDLAGS